MKKQILSIILMLCMVMTLLPGTAFAADTYYQIWFGNIRVNSTNANDVLGDGTVSFDAATNTLTLNNAHIDSSNGYYTTISNNTLIYINQFTTINLIGNNTVGRLDLPDDERSYGIYNKDSLTITGSGTLTVEAGLASVISAGLSVGGPLIVDGCTVTAFSNSTASSFPAGIYNWTNNISLVNGATLNLYATGPNGMGHKNNGGSHSFTIDGTSTFIAQGEQYGGGLLFEPAAYQIMLVSTSYDGTNAYRAYKNSSTFKYVKVIPAKIPTAADFTFTPPASATYSGSSKPATVVSNKEGMGEITVRYSGEQNGSYTSAQPVNVGTYYVRINVGPGTAYNSASNISDSSWTFIIDPLDITNIATIGSFSPLTYSGLPQTPVATVKVGSINVSGSWSMVTNVSDTTTFTANGNFTGSLADISPGMAKATPFYTVPTGLTAVYGQTLADVVLPSGFAWTEPSTSVGNTGTKTFTASYTPTDTANYKTLNNVSVNVTVAPRVIELSVGNVEDLPYNGSAQTPSVVVKDGDVTLTKDVDYTVSYSNNVNAGTATVTISGIGNYLGSFGTKTFNILRASVSNNKTDSTITYDGQPFDVSSLFTPDANAGTASYSIQPGGTGEGSLDGNILTITKVGTFNIGMVTAQTANYNAGSILTATLTVNKGSHDAPAGISKLNVTNKDGDDGKILNVTTDMEYKIDGGEYTEITGSEITDLSAGRYFIRYKETDLYSVGPDTQIVITEPGVIPADATVPDGITLETPVQSADTVNIIVAPSPTVAPEIQSLAVGVEIVLALDITAELNGALASTLTDIVKITLPIPDAAKGKLITVYRLHNGSAEELPSGYENRNSDGEYAVIGTDNAEIYVKNFSQYVLSYVPLVSKRPTSKYTITVTQTKGGKISPKTITTIRNNSETFTITPDSGYEIEDVLVNSKSVGAVKKYTFNSVTADASITAKFKKIEETPDAPSEPAESDIPEEWANPFTDTDENDWFYESVKYVNENGLMNGIDERAFAPDIEVTRAMFVTILYRAENQPDSAPSLFTDVQSGAYYEKAVAWAAENDIVNGVSDTEFVPDAIITREQMAVIIQRYAVYTGLDRTENKSLSFADSENISDYAKDAVAFCAEHGFMSGKSNNLFAPGDSATRAEVATVLTSFLKILQ